MSNVLCFVLMPFGRKPDAVGRQIDFDTIYESIIRPAIEDAGLSPLRADEEQSGGIIHKAMFERLVLCPYAVADMTNANANVFYELGVRHAVRPWRTVPIFAESTRLPFDVQYLRSLQYHLDGAGAPADAAGDRKALAAKLREARDQSADPTVDSPVYQLMDYLPRAQIPHEKTDLFREQVAYSAKAKAALARARKQKTAAAVQDALRDLESAGELDMGVLIDGMLSYRAVKAWPEMVAFIDRFPRELRETVMVQEQYGFALNRAGQGEQAEQMLRDVLRRYGPSPETLGILGRVYKDRWDEAVKAGLDDEARALLGKTIQTYLEGFEADFRDAYPGVNAVTLMEIAEPPDPRREELLPIVRYAVRRKMASRPPDYWDHATLLELAVLGRDEAAARDALGHTLAAVREPWEPETTARNLALIRQARRRRSSPFPTADDAERKLRQKAGLGEALP